MVKADVRGSLEAIMASLNDIGNDEVQVNIISSGIGGITENDVNLAITSGAIIVGFNVRADSTTRRMAEAEGVDIRYYSIIYQLLDEIKAALSRAEDGTDEIDQARLLTDLLSLESYRRDMRNFAIGDI